MAHSFPTRRSSDLERITRAVIEAAAIASKRLSAVGADPGAVA